MTVVYPSMEWCQAAKSALNNNSELLKLGKKWGIGFNGDWLYELEPGGGLEETAYVFIRYKAGECQGIKMVNDPSEVDAGFHVKGAYSDFKDLLMGKKEFIEGMVKAKFRKVKGDGKQLMRNAKFSKVFTETLRSVDAEFLGE